jgi:spermidine synthase
MTHNTFSFYGETGEAGWLVVVADTLGHRHAQGHGGVERVADVIEDRQDTCPEYGGHVWSMLLVGVWWLSLKTTNQYFAGFVGFEP